MRNNLRLRLMLWFGGILLLLLAGFGSLIYYYFSQNQEHKVLAQMRENAIEIEARVLAAKSAIRQGRLTLHLPPGIEAALIRDGKIAARSDGYDPAFCTPLAQSGKEFLLAGEDRMHACYWERFDEPFNGAIVLQKRNIPNEAEDLFVLLAVALPLLLLLLLAAGWRLTGRILEPIRRITRSIEALSVEDFSHTLSPPDRDDEIRRLTEAYNEMILRLREGVERMERFNSDVAHELRTPLTVIRGEIELALRRERDGEAYRRSLRTLAREVDNLQRISEGLLLLSRYDEGSIRKSFVPCRPDRLFEETLERYRTGAQKRRITLEIAENEAVESRCNPLLIETLFSNLLDNALKYSEEGGHIRLSLRKEEEGILFVVEDEGIGIPADELARITGRFYRVDAARSRDVAGFGLGLALAERAVRLHGGMLKIESEEGKGTRVEARWKSEA